MRIDIENKAGKYLFKKDGELIFSSVERKNLLRTCTLLKDRNNQLIAEIYTKYSIPFIQIKYIVKYQNNLLKILPKSIIGPYYILDYNYSKYILVKHRGLKYSVLKENKQIAYFIKESGVSLGFSKRKFIIEVDADADVNLVCIFFCAVFCDFESRAEINIDLGLMLKEEKLFDNNWITKK